MSGKVVMAAETEELVNFLVDMHFVDKNKFDIAMKRLDDLIKSSSFNASHVILDMAERLKDGNKGRSGTASAYNTIGNHSQ